MRALLTVLFLALPLAASAQEGYVTYTESIKIDIQLPPEMQAMRDRIPNSRTATKRLFFNEAASLMKNAPASEESQRDVAFEGGGGMRMFRMGGMRDNNELYTNLDEGTVVDKRDFLGRTFLVEGDQEAIAWRLTDEKAEFLGYPCMKAVGTRDTTTVEAWFTPEIPVSAGPAVFAGLPGLVLVATVDEGRTTYTATEVNLDPLPEGTLVAPTEGKKVTREEFDKIVEEKMKEMGGGRPGREGMRIMVRGN